KRVQRLLQVLRVLSDRTRQRSLRAELRAARSKTGRTHCCRRSANPDAGRASSEIAVPMVHRSFTAHPRKISAHQYSRVQSAGVSTFRGDIPDAAVKRDFAI